MRNYVTTVARNIRYFTSQELTIYIFNHASGVVCMSGYMNPWYARRMGDMCIVISGSLGRSVLEAHRINHVDDNVSID